MTSTLQESRIRHFCSTDPRNKPHLQEPFHHDGYLYATDGATMVRVIARDELSCDTLDPLVIKTANQAKLIFADIAEEFKSDGGAIWFSLPPFPYPTSDTDDVLVIDLPGQKLNSRAARFNQYFLRRIRYLCDEGDSARIAVLHENEPLWFTVIAGDVIKYEGLVMPICQH